MSYTKHNYKKGDVLLASQLNEMDDQIALNEELINSVNFAVSNIKFEIGSLSSSDGTPYTDAKRMRTADFIPVCSFGSILFKSDLNCSFFAYDVDYKRITSSSAWVTSYDIIYTLDLIATSLNIDKNSIKYIKILFKKSDGGTITNITDVTKKIRYYSAVSNIMSKSVLSGKKVSIYGDSISTFAGWIPSENATYYNGSNAGVRNVNETWWKKVINALDLELVVNNSWSGRAVSSIKDTVSGHTTDAGYKEANVLQLKSDSILPDIIIVELGGNDFNAAADLGTYDGSTTLPTSPTKFLDAYAIMLDLIMTNFPLADVYCCTLLQWERYGTKGFPEINSKGNSISQWNEGLKKLINAFGAKIIDHNVCGATYYNLSTYRGDYSSGIGLHPNAAGHSLMANQTIHDMDNAVRFRYIP